MKTARRLLGDRGERAAARLLRRAGFRIRCKNYVFGKFEVDIIAENRDFLVFAEVKTRTYDEENLMRYGSPMMAVDRKKQENLFAAAAAYIARFPTEKRIRFDVIEVYSSPEPRGRIVSLQHIPDAFRR